MMQERPGRAGKIVDQYAGVVRETLQEKQYETEKSPASREKTGQRSTEGGNISIAMLFLFTLAIFPILFLADLGVLLATKEELKAAADGASLAAAQEIFFLRDGREVAQEYARRNGARLVGYSSDGQKVVVSVEKEVKYIFWGKLLSLPSAVAVTSAAEIREEWLMKYIVP
jgi:uncharacterized membrane protein